MTGGVGSLETEGRSAALTELDLRPTIKLVRAVVRGHRDVLAAVEAAEPAIAALAAGALRAAIVSVAGSELARRVTRLGAMWRVILPLAAPSLATTAVLRLLEGWKEFMLALTLMNEETRKTLPVVLQSFVGRGDTDWGAIMAASMIYTLPFVVVFILLRKHLMTGTTAGAVKG